MHSELAKHYDAIRQSGTPAVTSTIFHYGDETVTVAIKSEH